MNPRILDILDRTEGRPDMDSLENNPELFHWQTADGVFVRPDQMTALHLFHTVRLLWNHTVPDAHQLKPYRQWSLTLDADEREEAMREMLAELGRRVVKEGLTPEQRAELATIRLKDKVWEKARKTLSSRRVGPPPWMWDEADVDEDAEAWARDELADMGDR